MPGRLSAVLVAYRSAGHLTALLPDLVPSVDEVVVVDNASDDDTAAVVAAWSPDATVVPMDVNRGFAAGANRGIETATGELILLLNPDIVLEDGAVEGLRAAAERHEGDIVGPVVLDMRGRVLPTRRDRPSLWSLLGEEVLVAERSEPGTFPACLWRRWRQYDHEQVAPLLSGVCLLFPRSLWERVGPFDEGYFLYWEEIDWQLRAHAMGALTWLVPRARIRHQRSGSTGLHDTGRAVLLGTATRRFLRRWMPGVRGRVALGLLIGGQLLRWAAWSAPVVRWSRTGPQRRAQHAATARTLLGMASDLPVHP